MWLTYLFGRSAGSTDFRRSRSSTARASADRGLISLGITQLEERRVLSATAIATMDDPGADSAGSLVGSNPLALQDGMLDGNETATEQVALELGSSRSPATEFSGDLVVRFNQDIDLSAWSGEHFGPGTDGVWQVSGDAESVVQVAHSDPSVFYSDFELNGQALEFNVQVLSTYDDDFLGFVVGYTPGDFSNADAEYLLIDWKQQGQDWYGAVAEPGLAVSRISGVPDSEWDFWEHVGRVEELARARTLRDTGWQDFAEHRFSIQYSMERLLVFVDGQLQFDLEAPAKDPFPTGRIGFYAYSQPSIEFGIPTVEEIQGQEGSPVTIVEEISHQDPTDQLSAEIDWGDGTITDGTFSYVNGTGWVTGQHVYADNGDYPIAVRLVDGDQIVGLGRQLVAKVTNVSPSLVVGDQTIAEGELLPFVDLGLVTDPGFDNDVLGTLETFDYTINWGDGTATDGGEVTIDTVGSAGVLTTGSFDGSHRFADNGEYTVLVNVVDDDGGTTEASFRVSVTNVAPTLVVVGDQTVAEGGLLSLVNLGLVTDPGFDNDVLGTRETFDYTIDWGDGTVTDGGEVTIDKAGSAGMLTAGSFDGSHHFADNGEYTVLVNVVDDDGGTTGASFRVTVTNVAPTLTVVGNQTIAEGGLLSLVNLGLVTDPGFDNDVLGTRETFDYTIDWGDGTVTDGGEVTIDKAGSAGMLTAGSFDGSHHFADNGEYTVLVNVVDDDGGTTGASFRVTVTNVAPTLTVVGNQTIAEGGLLSLVNLGLVTDPGFDNDVLGTREAFDYTIDWGDGTVTDGGEVTIDKVGSAGVLTTGSFDGSHHFADNGEYTVLVNVVDDDGGTTGASFRVTVTNVAPTLTVVGNQTIAEGGLLSLVNLGLVTDPGFNNDVLGTRETFDYTIDWGDGTAKGHGEVTLDTFGSPGVFTNGSFDGSHHFADNGIYTVAVTVVDDDRGSAEASFQVTVTNVSPTLAVVGDQTIAEGGLLSIVDLGLVTDPGFDNDVLGTLETFDYTIDWGDGTAKDHGAVTVDTMGLPGVSTDGSFDGAHVFADNGIFTVTVSVVDDDDGADTEAFQVSVTNVAPTLLVVDDQTVTERDLLSLVDLGRVTDPGFDNSVLGTRETFDYTINWGDGTASDGGDVTIDAAGSPGVLAVGSFDDSHRFAEDGLYTVTVTVVDDDGGSATASFRVDVEPREEIGTIREDPEVYIYTPPPAMPPVFSKPVRVHQTTADRTPPELLLRSVDYRPSGLDFDATAENYAVLRQVMPDGREGRSYRLPEDALENLPEILLRLPDDRYRVYQVRSDGPDRLIRDVCVRQGVVIDYGDASEGILDRPPQSQSPDESQSSTPDSEDIPDSAHQGESSPFTAIDEAWSKWDKAEYSSSSSSAESPESPATSSSDGAALPSSARSDALPPERGQMEGGSTEETAIGVSATLLSFRLRAGWHQQLDAAMSQFKGPARRTRSPSGNRPDQPR